MKINVEVENVEEFNFFYNSLMLGVLTAIKYGKISPNDGVKQVFSHNAMENLEHSLFHPTFYNLVWEGSELEDFDVDEIEDKKESLENMQNTLLNNYDDSLLKLTSPRDCQMSVKLGDTFIPIIKFTNE